MATPSLGLKMVLSGGAKAMQQLTMAKKEVKNTKPLWDKAIIIMEMSETKTFRAQGRPKWAGLKHRDGKILQKNNYMMQSVTAKTSDSIRERGKTTLKFGTKLPQAPTHQYGFPPRNIPERKFLAVYDEDIKRMEKEFAEDMKHRLEVVTSG